MITHYISRVLSLCFYGALIFIAIGFAFLLINGAGGGLPADEVDFAPIIHSFFTGNSDAAFMVAAFVICLSPFFSAIVLIVYGVKSKHPLIIVYSILLIILLVVSLVFE